MNVICVVAICVAFCLGIFAGKALVESLTKIKLKPSGNIFVNQDNSGQIEGMYVDFDLTEEDILKSKTVLLNVKMVRTRN